MQTQTQTQTISLLLFLTLTLTTNSTTLLSVKEWQVLPSRVALVTLKNPVKLSHPTLETDALSILFFKSKADLDSKLPYTFQTRDNYCHWTGIKCVKNRTVRLNLQSFNLRGTIPNNSLNRLTQLKVLSLRNNSLTGPIPDLTGLTNLKTLFLDRNNFTGSIPDSIYSLHTLLYLDLSRNNLTGSVQWGITGLDLLVYIRLEFNGFIGVLPGFNQSGLKMFNVSNNGFWGAVPVTSTLSRFGVSAFANNEKLCGVIVHVECVSNSTPPFFGSNGSAVVAMSPASPVLEASSLSPPFMHKHKRVGIVLGIVLGAFIIITAFLCVIVFCKSLRWKRKSELLVYESDQAQAEVTNAELSVTKNKKLDNSDLVFCEDEGSVNYTLDHLMRASAELLGRGTIGTTYKAVMDGGVTVSVKRLDAGKIADNVMFEEHMDLVGGLRHPNLVPVRAYFQAKEERLIVYDYQPNGSLFNLIHGSRSTRAKPLHWTSCLKIADDVAQGLAYIHQASRLIHGNLKSTNVLVGADFEACLTDYCLSTLTDPSSITYDLDSQRYRAPEIRTSIHVPTPKSDVYAFGVLLLELVTGKLPSQHPYLDPRDMPDWVRAMRDDDVEEDDRLGMLVDVASICSMTSPEQRPSMRQVLKMIQDIKERVVVEDDSRDGYCAY